MLHGVIHLLYERMVIWQISSVKLGDMNVTIMITSNAAERIMSKPVSPTDVFCRRRDFRRYTGIPPVEIDIDTIWEEKAVTDMVGACCLPLILRHLFSDCTGNIC